MADVSLLSDLDAITARLRRAGCVAAEEEAAQLVGAAPGGAVPEAWLGRRERGEPLAWITGWTEFCGRPLRVLPGVYVPRPHTEELAGRAASGLAAGDRAIDLCAGSGAVAAHLLATVPGARAVAADLDRAAVRCASANGVPAVVADLGSAFRSGVADLVTAVVPYVPTGELRFLPADVTAFEPRSALDGGPDGLDLARRLVVDAARLLRPGGRLVIELGGDQDRELAPTLAGAGFEVVDPWFDEDGDLRGLEARRP